MRRRMRAALRRVATRVIRPLYEYAEHLAEADLPAFANHPRNLQIERPRRLYDTDRVWIGDDVSIGPGSLIVPQTIYPTPVMRDPAREHEVQTFDPRIAIGHRVTATGGLTIAAMQEVVIEDDVMLASNVMICDGLHGYAHANEPYKYQPMFRIAPVRIGRGSWLGQNVVVLPGVTIGELAIIGANSVVSHDVPARAIAVGQPARVIKRWDAATQRWVPAHARRAGAVGSRG
ncbi:acyltransferase [Sulfurifustis variabilis]|nr:acyltransferase [Sulfurifustis variabilis]